MRRLTNHQVQTYSDLPDDQSAAKTLVGWQKITLIVALLLILVGFIVSPLPTGITIVAILSTIYFLDVFFNGFVVLKSLHHPPEFTFSASELADCATDKLPLYTILCPLYREGRVLPQFVDSIKALDWPKSRLEVELLLEEDDLETQKVAQSLNLPAYFQVIVVPASHPQTKPKACNFGLSQAKGEYLVIYDAEDRPDPLQLKKAYLAFNRSSSTVICLQAKLNYFNPRQNLLTRLFTAEYSLWFDVTLPGYQSINTAIPLGGTSNHFRAQALKQLHGWDAFNVTEDCDLGARLFKAGFKTAIIDSTTYEEATSSVGNWLRQRSRWIKGYIQTYLVHSRHPWQFVTTRGIHAFIFQLIVGGKIAFLLINPLLWIATIAYFVAYAIVGPTIESLYPPVIFYMAGFSAVFGNFLFLYYYMLGVAKRGDWDLVKYVYLIPLYWIGVSLAAVKALYQLAVKPHFWEKTNHGLTVASSHKLTLRLGFRWPKIVLPRPAFPKVARLQVPLLAAFWITIQAILFYYVSLDSVAADATLVLTGSGFLVTNHLISQARRFKWQISRFISDLRGLLSGVPNGSASSTTSLRILIFNWRDIRHTWAGGAEVYLHELSTRWVGDGHSVTLFCGSDGKSPANETLDGVKIIRRGGFYTVYLLAPLYYIFRLRGHFDIVIDSENGIPFFTPLFVGITKVLLIYHVHQDMFRQKLYFPADQIALALEARLMPAVYARQKIVTISQSSSADILKLGLSKGQDLDIVNPGVESANFRPHPKTPHPSFVYVGRIRPQKNVDVAIKSFATVVSRYPKAILTIAGWGEDISHLKSQAKSLGLSRSVLFLGRVSEAEKNQLLSQSWAALQPSSFEGWGITVIEANAAGTPVIASNVSGLRDSVIHNHTGLLVPVQNTTALSEAMFHLISSPRKRQSLARNARTWSTKFDWSTLALKFLSILHHTLESSHRPVISPRPAYDTA